MADNPLMEKADEIVKNGGMLVKMYFDVHGKTEEGTKNLATGFIKGLSQVEGVAMAVSQIESTKKEEDMYITFIMSVIAFDSVPSFYRFVGAYTPTAIEIIKPDKVELTKHDLEEIALFYSEVLFDMKRKLYVHALSPEERAQIEKALKAHSEVGKNLLKGGDENDENKH